MDFYSILITAIAGLIGIWGELFIGDKEFKTKKAKIRSFVIKGISSILAFAALTFGFIKWQQAKESSRKQKEEYDKIVAIHNNSIKNGKAVANIENASHSIIGNLDTVKNKFSIAFNEQFKSLKDINQLTHDIEKSSQLMNDSLIKFKAKFLITSQQQLGSLNDISSKTSDLLNAIPDHIFISWYGLFRANKNTVKEWNAILKTKNLPTIEGKFLIDKSFLEENLIPLDLSVIFEAQGEKLSYVGKIPLVSSLENSYQLLTENSKDYVRILYDSSLQTIEFRGIVKVLFNETSSKVNSLKKFDTCDVIFIPLFMLYYCEHDRAKINFEGLIEGKHYFSKVDIPYDRSIEGFTIKRAKILEGVTQ